MSARPDPAVAASPPDNPYAPPDGPVQPRRRRPGCDCPRCGRDIGVHSPMFALMPNRFRCPYCRSRLRYASADAWVWSILALVLAAVVMLAPLGRLLPLTSTANRRLVVLMLALLLFSLASYGLAALLRRWRRLEARSAPDVDAGGSR